MKIIFLLLSVFLYSCGSDTSSVDSSLASGEKLFLDNCVRCHGVKGVGMVKNWQKKLTNGKFPAPPLNGTAHSWHHSPKRLLKTINYGGASVGGWMPAFKNKLTTKEKKAILDYIYGLWPEKIKQKYDKRFK